MNSIHYNPSQESDQGGVGGGGGENHQKKNKKQAESVVCKISFRVTVLKTATNRDI